MSLAVTGWGAADAILPSYRFLVHRMHTDFHKKARRPLRHASSRANAAICKPSPRINEVQSRLVIVRGLISASEYR